MATATATATESTPARRRALRALGRARRKNRARFRRGEKTAIVGKKKVSFKTFFRNLGGKPASWTKEDEEWLEAAAGTLLEFLNKGLSEEEAVNRAIAAVAGGGKESRRPKAGQSARTRWLSEFADNAGLKPETDQNASVLRGVKLLGLTSTNGRVYPKETVARATVLYDGAKVNVNHPRQGEPDSPRDYRDRIGVIRGPHLREGDAGLFGDFHFNPNHALAEQVIWDAAHAPENLGFSHSIEAKVVRRNGQEVVEEIVRVQSVDLVADPATTRGLYESSDQTTEAEEEEPMAELTLESLRAEYPDLVEAIRAETIAEQADSTEIEKEKAENAARAATIKTLEERLEALGNEKTELAERLDRYLVMEAELKKKAEVDQLIKQSKLPEAVVTEVFRESLLKADADGRKALIEDRRTILKLSGGGQPQSREQRATEARADVKDSKSFVAAIT